MKLDIDFVDPCGDEIHVVLQPESGIERAFLGAWKRGFYVSRQELQDNGFLRLSLKENDENV